MVQVASRRPVTAEARVRFWVIPCYICGGRGVAETGFLSEYFGFPLYTYPHILTKWDGTAPILKTYLACTSRNEYAFNFTKTLL